MDSYATGATEAAAAGPVMRAGMHGVAVSLSMRVPVCAMPPRRRAAAAAAAAVLHVVSCSSLYKDGGRQRLWSVRHRVISRLLISLIQPRRRRRRRRRRYPAPVFPPVE